jgi:hypothetical protein
MLPEFRERIVPNSGKRSERSEQKPENQRLLHRRVSSFVVRFDTLAIIRVAAG